MELTNNEAKVLSFIERFHAKHGRSPSGVEIGNHFKYTKQNANAYLRALIAKGAISRGETPSLPIRIIGAH